MSAVIQGFPRMSSCLAFVSVASGDWTKGLEGGFFVILKNITGVFDKWSEKNKRANCSAKGVHVSGLKNTRH